MFRSRNAHSARNFRASGYAAQQADLVVAGCFALSPRDLHCLSVVHRLLYTLSDLCSIIFTCFWTLFDTTCLTTSPHIALYPYLYSGLYAVSLLLPLLLAQG